MDRLNCKWVSEDMMTMNYTKWEEGVTKELPEQNNLEVGREGLFHYVPHPFLAVVFKRYNGCIRYKKLYKVKPEGTIIEGWNTSGATKLTLIEQLKIPQITHVQQIAFGILCVLEAYDEPRFVEWATKWLSGEDRSYRSASTIIEFTNNGRNNAPVYAARAAFAATPTVHKFYCDDAVNENVQFAVYGADLINRKKNQNPFDLISLAHKAMEVK